MSKNQLNKQYCTYLTHYTGDKLPEWYIGSTSIKKILNGYNGSVTSKKYKTIWNSERKNNPHLFKTRILRKFYRRKITLIHELKLQKKHQVVKNDKYINLAYACINGFFGRDVSGENNPMYGKAITQTEEMNNARREKMLGFKHKKESIEIMRNNNIGINNPMYGKTFKHSDLTKEKMRNKATGRLHSKLTKEKMIKNNKASGNPMALKINIYNSNGELMFKCNGDFVTICLINKLPKSALKKSSKNNGEPILQHKIKNNLNNKFINWYAIELDLS